MGALINLFNLIPIWQLDGGRAFRSLTRPQRWLAVAAIATAWALAQEEGLSLLLLVLMVVGAARTVVERPAQEPDPRDSHAVYRPGGDPHGSKLASRAQTGLSLVECLTFSGLAVS